MHGNFLILTLSLLTTFSNANVSGWPNMRHDEVENLFAGFIYGAIKLDFMQQVQGCLNDTPSIEGLYPKIDNIMKDFSETRGWADLGDGVTQVASMVMQLPEYLGGLSPNC